MSDKKPFWEGKTCSEMAGLHVKVTFKNGTVATGVTDECGDIDGVDSLSCVDVDDKFVPCSYVESIELLDDPEYERIDNIENVQVGDIVHTRQGNHFPCVSNMNVSHWPQVYIEEIDSKFVIGISSFAYALRPQPKLPDHDGLWLDKDDNTWTMRDGSVQITCIGADDWCFTRPWFSTDSVQVLNAAPFRLAKAVEA
ncbi:hypothetical protein [Bifidobacterium longum]|uniref:hypothetical protein n=1 Tax=Bifidobacterium longum TaxID=216816 RepID=UPI001EDCB2F4|nr:hypothetical protein [Bifidobacterium longum]MCG4503151.1 hypothetical protein [Bifidobacterium longum]